MQAEKDITRYEIGIIAIRALITDVIWNGMGTVEINSQITIALHPEDTKFLYEVNGEQSVRQYFDELTPNTKFVQGENAPRLFPIYLSEKKRVKKEMLAFMEKQKLYFNAYCIKAIKEITEL